MKVHTNSLRLPTIKIPNMSPIFNAHHFQAYKQTKKTKTTTGLKLETQQKKHPGFGFARQRLECTGFSGFPPWILPSVTVEVLHFVVPIPGAKIQTRHGFFQLFCHRENAWPMAPWVDLGEGAYTPYISPLISKKHVGIIVWSWCRESSCPFVPKNRGVNVEYSECYFLSGLEHQK